MVKVKKDLTGMIFGRLTVLSQDDDYVTPKGQNGIVIDEENKNVTYSH